MNTYLQTRLYDEFGFIITVIFATLAGFMIKYLWDYFLVFQISIQSYFLSSLIATLISLLIEYILIHFANISLSAILALVIGYNIKFILDQNLFRLQ